MGARGPKARREGIEWSSEFAYALGLITTDGCLSSDGRHLEFTSKDLEQVENLRRCLGVTAKIAQKKNRKEGSKQLYFHVQWGDIALYRFLLEIGLMPRKSLKLAEMKVPDRYFFDFLRGHFDGDGSFYSYSDPRWPNSFMFYMTFTCASLPHLLWLQNRIQNLLHINGHVVRPVNGVPSLRFAKKEGGQLIAALYTGGVSLSRKRLKIERAMRIVDKSSERK